MELRQSLLDFHQNATIGVSENLVIKVRDAMRIFEIEIAVTPRREVTLEPSEPGERINPPGRKRGNGREKPLQLTPPHIRPVYQSDWDDVGFNENTAMMIEPLGTDGSNEQVDLYEFRVNMDNTPLKNESKQKRFDSDQHSVLSNQFLYTNVLVGLALLLEDLKNDKNESPDIDAPRESIEERVESVSRAIASFIPAILSLNSIAVDTEDQLEGLEEIG